MLFAEIDVCVCLCAQWWWLALTFFIHRQTITHISGLLMIVLLFSCIENRNRN